MIEIRIIPDDKERKREFHALVRRPAWGKTVLLIRPEDIQRIFSPKRLRILWLLKTPTASISTLAAELHRPFEAVHRDIKLLESYGLVKLDKRGRRVIPTLAGKISVPIIA